MRGGTFYITATGRKVYSKHLPMERVKTEPVPRVLRDGKMVPGASAGAQLPPKTLEALKAAGVTMLPGAHISEVFVSPKLGTPQQNDGVLLQWKDDKGRTQSAYSKEFMRRSAEKKWARVMANRPKVEAAISDMKRRAQTDPASAAALLMAQTALRPGNIASAEKEGHYGATTMLAKHISFKGDKASIEFIGKHGRTNVAVVDDRETVSALKAHAAGKKPNEYLFNTSKEQVRAAVPPGVKLKDLRTIAAATHAEQMLAGITPTRTGNDRKDAREVVKILKSVSTSVAAKLNNTPAMARRSYIPPQIIIAWGEKHGLPADWIKWP